MLVDFNKESIVALRCWADNIVITSDCIREETDRLISILDSNKESLGAYENHFAQLILHMQKYQVFVSESTEVLPKMLNDIADKIEEILYTIPDF